MKAERLLWMLILAVALAGCSQGATNTPAPTNAPEVAASATPASAALPTATSASLSAATATTAPSPTIAQPTATNAPASSLLPGGDLSGDQLLQIFHNSLAAYPWRWRESATSKDTKQTNNATIEVQSSTRAHVTQEIPSGNQTLILESILITPTLYMKGTGGDPNLYKQFGATEGQWMKVPPKSPLAGFAQVIYLLANPDQLLNKVGFLSTELGTKLKQQSAKFVGTEQVGATATNVYQVQTGSGDNLITYRWSIANERLYRMSSDSAKLTTNIIVEYDPSINIQPPIP